MTGCQRVVGLLGFAALAWVGCGGQSSRSDVRDRADAGSVGPAGTGQTGGQHATDGAGGKATGGAVDTGGTGGRANTGGRTSAAGGTRAGEGGSVSAGANTGAGGAEVVASPGATTFVLQNESDAPIYVQVENRQWLWVRLDGESVVLTSICWCGEASCPNYEPPLPAVAEIAPGERYAYDWDGFAAVWKDTCYERAVLEGEWEAEFCYGASARYSEQHFGDIVDEPVCKTVAFELGDASVVWNVEGL